GETPGQPVTPPAARPAPPSTAPGQAAHPSQPPLLPEPQIVEVPSSNNNGNGSPSASNNAADNGVAVAPKPAEPAPPPAKKPQTAANGSSAPHVANNNAQASAAATPPKAAQAPKGASSATTTAAKPTSGADANTGYFLQVGAYKTEADAEQQRARLGFQGFESKVSKRDVSGVTYFRVRIGPFSKFEDMNSARQRLSDAGVDTAVIRFTKQ
ncbi:SPOR domain-containing protein, partial [Burkholderia pseudomallei]|uniref:SPOR domain-containing protein n=1 Tax=Burkholderia pseudomallei TaxID=28450 RepID=UPI000975B2FF